MFLFLMIQRWKLRLREGERLTQGHATSPSRAGPGSAVLSLAVSPGFALSEPALSPLDST